MNHAHPKDVLCAFLRANVNYQHLFEDVQADKKYAIFFRIMQVNPEKAHDVLQSRTERARYSRGGF